MDLLYFNKVDLSDKDDIENLWESLHAISTLQGVVNRDKPQLYINYIVNDKGQKIDEYWWNKYYKIGEWLHGKDKIVLNNLVDAIKHFSNEIKGVVVYDPCVASTSNIASSISGIDDLIAVRYNNKPGSLYNRIISGEINLPVKCWLINKDGSSKFTGRGIIPETNQKSTGSIKIDPYVWFIENYMKKGKCNTEYAAYYIDQYWLKKPTAAATNHHQLTNHDFFVSKRAFFFDLSPWEDEPATDDVGQKIGLDSKVLKEMLLLAYNQNKGKKFCYIGGFPCWAYKYTKHSNGKHDDVATEWEFSRIISAYNAFKDADAIGLGALANSSFWQHFPLDNSYPQEWVSKDNLIKRGYLNEDGTLRIDGRDFIIFYVGDFDASAWITQTTPYLWDNPDRGSIPLMWCISPVLSERVPMVMHNYRKTATGNDYFASADNGAGYLMPGMLQEPRPISGLPDGLKAWRKHCKKFYNKWGLSITGFIIDGEAPGLNKKGLDCYKAFSSNGIVPQKSPLTFLYGDMPVLKFDYDIVDNDPKKAVDIMMWRIDKRPIPFHWFRAILKSPTWYKDVYEEIRKRNPKIELLDAPTFFELYRIYLKQNKDAALGNIGRNVTVP